MNVASELRDIADNVNGHPKRHYDAELRERIVKRIEESCRRMAQQGLYHYATTVQTDSELDDDIDENVLRQLRLKGFTAIELRDSRAYLVCWAANCAQHTIKE